MAVRPLDWNLGPAPIGVEAERLVAERIGQVEPAKRPIEEVLDELERLLRAVDLQGDSWVDYIREGREDR